MGNISAIKFSQSTHHGRHADVLGADVVRCNQYKKGVDGYTRISKKYLIKYGCVGNQYVELVYFLCGFGMSCVIQFIYVELIYFFGFLE